MKKSITAVAVLTAMALPFAAQAGDEAEIYGKLNVSTVFVDNADDTDAIDSIYLTTNSSRIGVKGSTELKGDLKASWKVENEVFIGSEKDGTRGNWATRNTYVALDGGFGTLVLGRHDTPFKNARKKVGFFGDQPGEARGVVKLKNWDKRADGVLYKSPSFGGASIYAQAEPGSGNSIPLASAAVVYKMDKSLFASVAYEVHDVEGADENESGIRAGAKYTMGAISVAGFFQQITAEKGKDGADRSSYGGGAAYKMGGTTLKTQYYMTSDTKKAADEDTNGALLAFGVDQKLGKMTKGYLVYAMSMNGDRAQYSATGQKAGHDTTQQISAPAVGESQMAIALGLIHEF